MQFGPIGRGKGNEYFILGRLEEEAEEYFVSATKVCEKVDKYKRSDRIMLATESPRAERDAWLEDVAKRVRKRWDERKSKKWCDQCGAPLPKPKGCPCGEVFYCDAKYQRLAWKFHKLFCATKIGKK